MNEVAVRRVEKETDNTRVDPVDLLHLVIADIERGNINPHSIMVVAGRKDEDGSYIEIDRYRCGVTRVEEIALLADAQYMALRGLRGHDD